jgi:pyruvate formate lyase activating enzyme
MKIAGIIKSSLIDYPGKASTVIFLGGCNFKCGYCHNPELVHFEHHSPLDKKASAKENFIDMEDFLGFLRRRKRFLDGVCISGGEPTLYEDLPLLMTEIKNLGYNIKLDTNGTKPDMIKRLISIDLVDYFAMDIKGPFSKYEEITRGKVHIEAVKESAKLLIKMAEEKGFDYEFRTTLCRELLSKEDLKEMVKEHPGATKWFLQSFRRQGSLLDNEGTYSAYGPEEMEELGKMLCVSVR